MVELIIYDHRHRSGTVKSWMLTSVHLPDMMAGKMLRVLIDSETNSRLIRSVYVGSSAQYCVNVVRTSSFIELLKLQPPL